MEALSVLLVEDNDDDARLIERTLSQSGRHRADIRWVRSLAEALRSAADEPPGITLLDLNLGDSGGLDTVSAFISAFPFQPVVVLSGLNDGDTARLAIRAGCQDFFVKDHLTVRALWRAIANAIERKQQDVALQKAYASLQEAHEELRSTQRQLMEVEKEISIGRLAAGIAHEFKNPLGTVNIGIKYLRKTLVAEGNPKLLAILSEMQDAVDRADGIAHALMDYGSPRNVSPNAEDVNQVVRDAFRLVRLEFERKQASIEMQLAESLPSYPLDRNKMVQVLLNLFLNASQALPPGGVVRVCTACGPGGDLERRGLVQLGGDLPRDYPLLLIAVYNQGPPIPPDHLGQVFEPFFTTKPPGQGTGLGLSVARSIVQMHGGGLALRNAPDGVWAEVRFVL